MNNTNKVTVETIKGNPNGFIFCHIPKWAKFAEVTLRGEVKRWSKK